jgi:hypothetical protein
MLIGCGCFCNDGSEQTDFSSTAASTSGSTSSVPTIPAAGCIGCMDSVAPTSFTFLVDYTGADTQTVPGFPTINFPCCSYYKNKKRYKLKRQTATFPNGEPVPGLQHCCYWESDERAMMYDPYQPDGQECVTTQFARAFAVVYSPPPTQNPVECPHEFALTGGSVGNTGPWHIAAGLRFLFKTGPNANEYRSAYLWWAAGNRNLVANVDCLANITCDYAGQHWDLQETQKKWSSNWMQPFYSPCFNDRVANNGIPDSVSLLAAGA